MAPDLAAAAPAALRATGAQVDGRGRKRAIRPNGSGLPPVNG